MTETTFTKLRTSAAFDVVGSVGRPQTGSTVYNGLYNGLLCADELILITLGVQNIRPRATEAVSVAIVTCHGTFKKLAHLMFQVHIFFKYGSF